MFRLNKFIADSGLCSRRKADDLIKSGLVKVNGSVQVEPGTKILNSDIVEVNGNKIKSNLRLVYLMLNKPKDTITTSSDEKGRKTVLDIVKSKYRVFPVGRLDRNTTGILLFTNDGELANRLTHPKFEIERTYSVGLDKKIKPEDARRIAEGVELNDGKTSKCEVFINPNDNKNVIITLIEGKNREIRRIFESLGYEVKKLDRKSFAGLTPKGLARGEYRHLTRAELLYIKKITGIQ